MTAVAERAWQVGDRIGPLAIDPVTRTTLALFAGGSGDHNPIHVDLDVARASGLDDVFAHGMLSMAYLGRLLTDAFGVHALTSFSTRFTAITPVGAEPTCTAEIVALEGSSVRLDLRVGLPDGTVTLTGAATVSLDSLEGSAL
jgi:acyl dehydratase